MPDKNYLNAIKNSARERNLAEVPFMSKETESRQISEKLLTWDKSVHP